MRSSLALSLAVAATLAVCSCSGSSNSSNSAMPPTTPTPAPTPTPTPAPTPTPTQRTVTVAIVGSSGTSAFSPNPVSANVGDAINFMNNSTTTHHIVLDDGTADLGLVSPGATSQSLTLKSALAAGFHCTIHGSMTGNINGAVTPPPPTNPSPY